MPAPPELPVEPLPIEPPVVGELVEPLFGFVMFDFAGTCDCCLFEWLIRPDDDGLILCVDPDDVDGDDPDVP